tara:strand:- start:218 stop:433 length:216 start_codon:yes stop_codon:yes gene_type:complete
MSTFYVANQNGDWWSIDTETGQGVTLFVISEADLKKALADESPEEQEVDLGAQDKLEQVITEHGEAIDFNF